MFILSRLGSYVALRTLVGVAVAFAGVVLSILLIDLVEQMRTVGSRTDVSLLDAFQLTLMKTPMLVEQTLPFIMLAGAMLATGGLNRSSELVALRASGVSAWRFLTPAMVIGAIAGLITITMINPLGSQLYQDFEAAKDRLLSQYHEAGTANGVWIRQGDAQGQIVIHAESVSPNGGALSNADFMFFDVKDDALHFQRRIHAAKAELKAGFWQLSDLVEATPARAPEHSDSLAIPTSLNANEMIDRLVTPATLSFWRLPGFIADARAAGFAPTRYELKWYGLLAYPIMLAAMALLGATFSLRLQRLGGLAQWMAIGVCLGLFLFFYSQLAGAFAMTQAAPALVAAFSAPLAGLFVGLAMVAFLEDG